MQRKFISCKAKETARICIEAKGYRESVRTKAQLREEKKLIS